MPRRSTREEAAKFMAGFFEQAKARLTADLLKTMQPQRREEMFNTITAVDKVEAEFYNWLNGIDDNG